MSAVKAVTTAKIIGVTIGARQRDIGDLALAVPNLNSVVVHELLGLNAGPRIVRAADDVCPCILSASSTRKKRYSIICRPLDQVGRNEPYT